MFCVRWIGPRDDGVVDECCICQLVLGRWFLGIFWDWVYCCFAFFCPLARLLAVLLFASMAFLGCATFALLSATCLGMLGGLICHGCGLLWL